MNIRELVPLPTHREVFKRNRERFIPSSSGCYVLTTFSMDVLYVGLTKNLRSRMNNHLDDPEKVSETELGSVTFFHWLVVEVRKLEVIERTWQGIHIQYEGHLPFLNKVYSPTST